MKSRWVVIETPNDVNNERICDAVAASGREFKLASIGEAYEGFSGKITQTWCHGNKVIVTGPVLPSRYCTDTYNWISWLDTEKTTCADYYPPFTRWTFQFPYVMIPLGDLKRNWHRLCHWLMEYDFNWDPDTLKLFVRPNENNKAFSAMAVSFKDLDYLQQAGQPGNVICIVSRYKEILAEYRLFFRGTEYLTGSLYKVSGNLIHTDFVPKVVIEWATDVAKECHYVGLPPVWVMDVAEWPVGHYSVLEVSGALCAGFYSADIQKVVEAISQEVENLYPY